MIKPLNGKVFVQKLQHGERKVGSIILRDDDSTTHGVKPRWAQVYAIGEDITDLRVGQWVLITHGRWTRELVGIDDLDRDIELRVIEYPESVLLVTDEEPADDMVLDTDDLYKKYR